MSAYEVGEVGMQAARVACPRCGALSGEPCRRPGGQRTYTHQGRERALETHDRTAERVAAARNIAYARRSR